MKRLLGWIMVLLMVVVVALVGCQNATSPNEPIDRPVPVQYRTLNVPIINTVP